MLSESETRLFLEGILMGMLLLWGLNIYKDSRDKNNIIKNLREYDKKEKAQQQ